MEKRYWTGKELIEAGYATAIVLGKLAGEGIITAWHEVGFSQYSTIEIYRIGFHSKCVIPFPFDLEDFAKDYDIPGCPDGPIIGIEYRTEIESMIFEYEEVKKALDNYYSDNEISENTNDQFLQNEASKNINNQSLNNMVEDIITGWKAIENELNMNKKIIKSQGFPIHSRSKGKTVYAFKSELMAHLLKMKDGKG